MIDPDSIHNKAVRIEKLLTQKFNVKARSLPAAFRKVGRRVPKHIHAQAGVLFQAQSFVGNPKLARRLDAQQIDKAFRDVQTHLIGIDPVDHRIGAVLGAVGAAVFNLLLFSVVLLTVLTWRGFL